MIYGLISSYREGQLLKSCLESVRPACDHIAIYEGPIGDVLPASNEKDLPLPLGEVWRKVGRWDSDHHKRNELLNWAKKHYKQLLLQQVNRGKRLENLDHALEQQWIVWIDGDEVLIWGEYLPDWIDRAEKETSVGGFPIRLVEMDGSVYKSYGRIMRAAFISGFQLGVTQTILTSGMVVGLPNQQICGPGGVPANWGEREINVEDLAELRPPVHGEPHILHRSFLRDPSRGAERVHVSEQQWYEERSPVQ